VQRRDVAPRPGLLLFARDQASNGPAALARAGALRANPWLPYAAAAS